MDVYAQFCNIIITGKYKLWKTILVSYGKPEIVYCIVSCFFFWSFLTTVDKMDSK